MLTEKRKKTAQNVEKSTKKPKVPDGTVPAKPVEQKKKATAKDKHRAVLFDLSKFDQEKIEAAEAMGLPLRQLANTMNQYAESVEIRFQLIQESMPQRIQDAMTRAIEEEKRKQIEALRNAPEQATGGGGLGGTGITLGDAIKFAMQGGGGQDTEMVALTKEMMKVNIEGMKADIGFSRAIKSALVSKITGKAIGKILE